MTGKRAGPEDQQCYSHGEGHGCLFCSIVTRPHNAHFLCTLKGINTLKGMKASKENEQYI